MLNKVLMIISLIGLIACAYVGYIVKDSSQTVANTIQRDAIENKKWRADMLAEARAGRVIIFKAVK